MSCGIWSASCGPSPIAIRTPSTSGLPALIAESTAAGTPAELAEDGDPALASPVVGRTAYRIVREALTNARKHAPGAHVLVQIGYGESQVRVVVSNGPATRSADSELSGTGSGLGLAGLRQRVELMHGTLRAGPAPDGGFRVEAVLPAYVPTAEPADHTETGGDREGGAAPAARRRHDPGRRRRRRADGLRAPAHDPRLVR